jgi:hypothetical protein
MIDLYSWGNLKEYFLFLKAYIFGQLTPEDFSESYPRYLSINVIFKIYSF